MSAPPRLSRRERAAVLRRFGARDDDLDALLDYTDNPFDPTSPLLAADEPHVVDWRRYAEQAKARGGASALAGVVPQVRFPIGRDVAATDAYFRATRLGDSTTSGPAPPFLGKVEIDLHPTPAGRLPYVAFEQRDDFVRAVRSVLHRNAPEPVPSTMGAVLVSGFNNWDRVDRYRARWLAEGGNPSCWPLVFADMRARPELYQDRFALVSRGPYGGLDSGLEGLSSHEWESTSLALRLHHEAAHYYCRRVLGAMRSNLLDEWIAESYAVVSATVQNPAAWVRALLTDERTGRAGSYVAPLSPPAGAVVVRLLHAVTQVMAWSEMRAPTSYAESARLIRRFAAGTLEEQWLANSDWAD